LARVTTGQAHNFVPCACSPSPLWWHPLVWVRTGPSQENPVPFFAQKSVHQPNHFSGPVRIGQRKVVLRDEIQHIPRFDDCRRRLFSSKPPKSPARAGSDTRDILPVSHLPLTLPLLALPTTNLVSHPSPLRHLRSAQLPALTHLPQPLGQCLRVDLCSHGHRLEPLDDAVQLQPLDI
jgi:hypothetical protein